MSLGGYKLTLPRNNGLEQQQQQNGDDEEEAEKRIVYIDSF